MAFAIGIMTKYKLCENTLPAKPVNKLSSTLSAKPLTNILAFNSQSLFASIADQPWAMWLDSSESEHIDSCYDILVWQPEVTLCTYGDKTIIHHTKTNKNAISCLLYTSPSPRD